MESVSKFLAGLGFPLRTVRQSWGAHSSSGVLLITWAHDIDKTGRFVRVLAWRPEQKSTFGQRERVDHLRALWSGGLAGYAVIATARDISARPRSIQSYETMTVRAIVSLIAQPDGSIWAELGEEVPVKRLKKHAESHRLFPDDDPFPVEQARAKTLNSSAASYIAKLPAVRLWLIEVARRRGKVTYAEARIPFGLRTLEHRHAMDRLGHECLIAGEPILTALIVDAGTNRCSSGFFKEFRRDDVEEREDCYAFWSPPGASTQQPQAYGHGLAGNAASGGETEDALRERAARFAKAASRPEQQAFRRRVFLAQNGACFVTQCSIPETLDAAHRQGRDWKLGHNNAEDGLLLRKDIHALYDAKLVSIDSKGTVKFHPDIAAEYDDYDGKP